MTCWMKHESAESQSAFWFRMRSWHARNKKTKKRSEVNTLRLLLLFLLCYWSFYSNHRRGHLCIKVACQKFLRFHQKKKERKKVKSLGCLPCLSSSGDGWIFHSVSLVLYFSVCVAEFLFFTSQSLQLIIPGQHLRAYCISPCWLLTHISSLLFLSQQGRVTGKRQACLIGDYFFSSKQNHSGM